MKKRKLELGYSYRQISELSGVPFGTVQKIFRGATKAPRYETLCALEKVFTQPPSGGAVLHESPSTYIYRQSPDTVGAIGESSPAYYYMDNTRHAFQGKKQGEYTLEDYYALPDERRVELIDGVIYDMSAPTSIHQILCAEISYLLTSYIHSKKGDCISLVSPVDVQLDCDDKTMIQPDVIVVCDRSKIIKRCIYGAPDFVIEILSPSTKRKDMFIKLSKYKNAGVREYWLIDPDKKQVVVYDFGHDDSISVYGFDSQVPVGIFEGECVIDFVALYDYISFLYETPEE